MRDGFFDEEVICGYKVSRKMKQIWAVQLDLAKQLKRVCEKYNLRYFMYAGTLIGAIRHNGYIPWDDDFDIIMPRADYNKLKLIAQEEFRSPYFFQTNENTPAFFSGNLSRLRNSNTTAVEYWDVERKGNWGIWIDIIAFDYLYTDSLKRRKQLEQISYYQRLNLIKTYGTNFWGYHDLTMAQKEVYAEIAAASDRNWLLKKFEEACTVCKEEEAFYVGTFTRYNNIDSYRCWYKEDFDESIYMMFEGIELPAPIGYERFLYMSRGKYMELPPIEDRFPKHQGIYDPEQSFEELQHRLIGTYENIQGKKIVIFGCGEMLEDYMKRYGKKYLPSFVVDNDKSKWGKEWNGIMVEDPAILKTIPDNELHLIVCNKYFREIEVQLKKLAIKDYYLYIQKPEWLNTILYPQGQDFGGPLLGEAQKLILKNGCEVSKETGELKCGVSGCMATELFYRANSGSRIELMDDRFLFSVATYSSEINGTYIYTYTYQKEQNWSSYNYDMKEYSSSTYEFWDNRYFRISVKRVDGKELLEEDLLPCQNAVRFVYADKSKETLLNDNFEREVERTVERIRSFRDEESVVIGLISDTHYCVNGTWKDTIQNIKAVNQREYFDGLIHLGDMTDGMVSADVTRVYVREMLSDMQELEIPLYVVLGNHDSNYFAGNQEPFTNEEEYELYQKFEDNYVERENHDLWYYADFSKGSLRCIFLDSFDYREKERYGYPDREVEWLKRVLMQTPAEYSVLVFSHVPPLPEIHFWSDTIRNGEQIIAILENFNKIGNKVLGFVHGHNHADQIYRARTIPIISIGCNKCEYFLDKKPNGAFTPMRILKDVTQDLWDIIIVNAKEGKVRFLRFGAGEDRML